MSQIHLASVLFATERLTALLVQDATSQLRGQANSHLIQEALYDGVKLSLQPAVAAAMGQVTSQDHDLHSE